LGEDISKGKFKFTPARQVMIPKASGGTRPLGIGSPREKIVQKALTVILEQI
jgi:retron-type reverse transcriptase